ncbi:hypothetical protein [uncultured Shewanella sp.]|uniref:hypothetical protein n=1 Tax=uncultured Shewanella sp. TaxID=173975 RepID=UPI0026151D43|nr:hypothetical protein [uncultured Shewanella sp.]
MSNAKLTIPAFNTISQFKHQEFLAEQGAMMTVFCLKKTLTVVAGSLAYLLKIKPLNLQLNFLFSRTRVGRKQGV